MIRRARDEPRACASVLATTKSTPDRPEPIILLIALPPAPPTPHTTMRGLSSFSWGAFRLIGIPCLTCWARADAALPSAEWPDGTAFPTVPATKNVRFPPMVASGWSLHLYG